MQESLTSSLVKIHLDIHVKRSFKDIHNVITNLNIEMEFFLPTKETLALMLQTKFVKNPFMKRIVGQTKSSSTETLSG